MRIFPTLGRALPLPERVFSFVHGLYYLHGLGSALSAALLSFMLVTGRTPGVFSVATGWRVVVLFAVLQACDLFRQRFFLEPGARARAALAGGAAAAGEVAARAARPSATRSAGPNRGYLLTSEGRAARNQALRRRPGPPDRRRARGHGVGGRHGRGVIDNQVLDVAAGFVVALSLLVAVSELRRFPPPYDDELASRELASD